MQAEFELLMPKTLSEALTMLAPAAARGLADSSTSVTPIAGGTNVVPDLRGGFSHLIAALAAEGTSTVFGIGIIDRGYENFRSKLAALGASVNGSA